MADQEYTLDEIQNMGSDGTEAQPRVPTPPPVPDPDQQQPEYTLDQIQRGVPEVAESPSGLAEAIALGIGKGVVGPVAPATAIGLGATPEHLRNLEEAFPQASPAGELTGFIGSMLTGTGEAALLEKAGEGITKLLPTVAKEAPMLSKMGSTAVRKGLQLATEFGLYQTGSEVSKLIQEDPEQTLGSAAANVGMSTLLGLGGGVAFGGISPLAKAGLDRAGEVFGDFQKRLKFHAENLDVPQAVTSELSDRLAAAQKASSDIYGVGNLKGQAIEDALPQLNDRILNHSVQVNDTLADTINSMKSDPDLYPVNLVARLEKEQRIYQQTISQGAGERGSAHYFDATQRLKQAVQDLSGYGQVVRNIDPEGPFVKQMRELGPELKASLEDRSVWGKAADIQADINSKASDFFKSSKRAMQVLGTKGPMGELAIDPVKVNTLINQSGKAAGSLKRAILGTYLDTSDALLNTYAKYSPEAMQALSSPISKIMAGEQSAGTKLADTFVKKSLANMIGRGAGAAIGEYGGQKLGLPPGTGGVIGGIAIGPALEHVVPGIAKAFMSKAVNAEGLNGAVRYGMAAARGDNMLSKAAKDVFKGSAEVLSSGLAPSDKVLDKMDEGLKAAENDPQKLMNTGVAQGYYMPEHTSMMARNAANMVAFYKTIRPNTAPNSPLGDDRKPNAVEQAAYRRALAIGEQPAMILKHIKDGSLTDRDLHTIASVNPGAAKAMQNKLVHEMAAHAGGGDFVPYKSQASISKFLGTPLSSSFQPQNILANQQLSKPGQQQQQVQASGDGKSKTGQQKSALQKLSGMYNTPVQAREQSKTQVS